MGVRTRTPTRLLARGFSCGASLTVHMHVDRCPIERSLSDLERDYAIFIALKALWLPL